MISHNLSSFLLFAVVTSVYSLVVSDAQDRSLATARDHNVAFSAGLTRTLTLSQGEVINYGAVFTNEGNAFDPSSGVFHCPRSGLYFFQVHAYHSNAYRVMWLDIMKDDMYLVSVSGYNSHSSAGNAVIIHVNVGERVFIKAKQGQNFDLFGARDQIYSTFSGYLISPDSRPTGP